MNKVLLVVIVVLGISACGCNTKEVEHSEVVDKLIEDDKIEFNDQIRDEVRDRVDDYILENGLDIDDLRYNRMIKIATLFIRDNHYVDKAFSYENYAIDNYLIEFGDKYSGYPTYTIYLDDISMDDIEGIVSYKLFQIDDKYIDTSMYSLYSEDEQLANYFSPEHLYDDTV